jgi:hypothetical protein
LLYFSDFSTADRELYDETKQFLHINHYQHMSLEYYTNVKMIRGPGNSAGNGYNINRFNNEKLFFNVVSDCELSKKK